MTSQIVSKVYSPLVLSSKFYGMFNHDPSIDVLWTTGARCMHEGIDARGLSGDCSHSV
jgi:hypothetical protein